LINGFKRFLACLNMSSFLIKTDENEDPNEYLPPTRYVPCADYDKLALETFYKNNPGDPFAEEIKKIIESLN
jgi:hypothetical protein